jgi:4-phosphopantoate--beta-alanine ligase
VIPKTHPRKTSLEIRHKLTRGFTKGLVTQAGLIAHGRGEAFDYLLGEKTTPEARKAEEAAVSLMLLAKRPVISVNGNATALCAEDIVRLARLTKASLEVNLFYRSVERALEIASALRKAGAKEVYGVGQKPKRIKHLSSKRALVDEALWESDVVLVPLEDGDRTEALEAAGKKVIAIDLNPLSRTARKASVTIVDNIVRAVPKMNTLAVKLGRLSKGELKSIASSFNNKANLRNMERLIRKGL